MSSGRAVAALGAPLATTLALAASCGTSTLPPEGGIETSAEVGADATDAETEAMAAEVMDVLSDYPAIDYSLPDAPFVPVNDLFVSGGDTCAITTTGELYCWGLLSLYEVGADAYPPDSGGGFVVPKPLKIPYLPFIDAFSIGVPHLCARYAADGRVNCWGGTGVGDPSPGTPYQRSPGEGPMTGVTSPLMLVAFGGGVCMAFSGKQVRCYSHPYWDDNPAYRGPKVDASGDEVKQLAFGGKDFFCFVSKDGKVRCAGRNDVGQLGRGTLHTVEAGTDGLTTDLEPQGEVVGLSNVVEVAAGFEHACARTATGEVWCWGSNDQSALGLPYTGVSGIARSAKPLLVSVKNVVSIAASGRGACVVDASGSAWCWGAGTSGDGYPWRESATPVRVVGIVDGVRVVDAHSATHTCVLRKAGQIACWGYGGNGALGNGSLANQYLPVPVLW